MRNMVASAGFKHAIQRIEKLGVEKQVMGPYLPGSNHTTKAAFQQRACAKNGAARR